MPSSRFDGWAALVCAIFTWFGCAKVEEEAVTSQQELVYGIDNRVEDYEYADKAWLARLKDVSVAMMNDTSLDTSDPSDVRVIGTTLGNTYNVCSDERFVEQPTAALCSGTLIGSDLVLTAGHCLAENRCPNVKFVFNYAMAAPNELSRITMSDVFSCREVRTLDVGNSDYAIVQLDRAAEGHVPAKTRRFNTPVEVGQSLVFSGHPTGLPRKTADGANVKDARSANLDYFFANLDSFPGNSGSGVFLKDTGELVGCVFGGVSGTGYVQNSGEACSRPELVSDDHETQIRVTYAGVAVTALCSERPSAELCSCGNGVCDSNDGENSRTCAADCGTICNDGVCNGEESATTCYDDCGACGNGICEAYEVSRLSCCEDCGCPTGYTCQVGVCGPSLGNVNADAQVDIADVHVTKAIASGWYRKPFNFTAADVDCNGQITFVDAHFLENFVKHEGQPFPSTEIVDIAVGARHTCVLVKSGQVRCWGDNTNGQLGGGIIGGTPSSEESMPLQLGAKVTQVVAGMSHTCVLFENGFVRCWGAGASGQLGYGSTVDVADATSVGNVKLEGKAVRLAAGGNHTCAVLDGGALRCWGSNTYGELGLGNKQAVGDNESPADVDPVQLAAPVIDLAVASMHTCAVLADGTLYCWGGNTFGQLGLGHTRAIGDDETPLSAGPISLGANAHKVSVGLLNTCVLLITGEIRCWGDNLREQLGYGTTQRLGDRQLPTSQPVVPLGGIAKDVSVGTNRVCALYEDSSVRCWGMNNGGQLGVGTTQAMRAGQTAAAVPVLQLDGMVSRLVTQTDHSCALLTNGALRCWGANGSRQLGYPFSNNIGDDELPNTIDSIPLFGTTKGAWRFVNPYKIDVQLVNGVVGSNGVTLGVRVRNSGSPFTQTMRVLYQLNAAEAPQHPIEIIQRGSSLGTFTVRKEKSNAYAYPSLYSLEYQLTDLLTHRGHNWHHQHTGASIVNLKFGVEEAVWDATNDYSFADHSVPGRWYSSSRVQVLDGDGTLIYGWTRDAD